MKKIINKYTIFSFILGGIVFSSVSIYAYLVAATNVSYTPSNTSWNVSDVNGALNSLYTMANYGDATAGDIKSGKKALVNGSQVTGTLSVPSYTTLSNTENVAPGSSSTSRTGYYYLSNYKVTCGTTTCPSYTSLSGTQNVAAGSSSATLTGYYNMSNYKVSCASCSSAGVQRFADDASIVKPSSSSGSNSKTYTSTITSIKYVNVITKVDGANIYAAELFDLRSSNTGSAAYVIQTYPTTKYNGSPYVSVTKSGSSITISNLNNGHNLLIKEVYIIG